MLLFLLVNLALGFEQKRDKEEVEKVKRHRFCTVKGEDYFDSHLFDVVYMWQGRYDWLARAVATQVTEKQQLKGRIFSDFVQLVFHKVLFIDHSGDGQFQKVKKSFAQLEKIFTATSKNLFIRVFPN